MTTTLKLRPPAPKRTLKDVQAEIKHELRAEMNQIVEVGNILSRLIRNASPAQDAIDLDDWRRRGLEIEAVIERMRRRGHI